MKHLIRRITAQLAGSGAITYLLPMETRVDARRAARQG
jgi:hypothetical protein